MQQFFRSLLKVLWEFLNPPKEVLPPVLDPDLQPIIQPPVETPNDKLIRIADALALLNIDVTPDDKIPDEVACVEVLCEVINKVIPFPKLSYTPDLVKELKADKRFAGTLDFNEASIIVNATGTGNGTMRGHCGIIGTNNEIISNNSKTGKWEYNYTIKEWTDRFRVKGGMPTLLFKLITQ